MTAIDSSTVQFTSDEHEIHAFLARPDTPDPAATVLILQEWWGLNDHIKDIARRFANEGYVALAPDLYSRMGHPVTTDADEAAQLMNKLSSQDVLLDLNAATKWLGHQPFVDEIRMGAIGFCMGGTFALNLAGANSQIKATVPFYGKVPPIETINYYVCPVLYHYGEQDGWVTTQEVARLEKGLAQYGKTGAVHRYGEAGHAFFNDTRPDAYHEPSAQLAWRRTLDFFAEHLR